MVRALILLLFLSAPAVADECVTVDVTTWNQAQKNRLRTIGYGLMWQQTQQDIYPTYEVDQLCFPGTTVDPDTLGTPAQLLAAIDADLAESAAATAAAVAQQQAYADEVVANNFCTATLDELDQRIDAAVDGATTVAEIKQVIKTGLKKLARCVRARAGRR